MEIRLAEEIDFDVLLEIYNQSRADSAHFGDLEASITGFQELIAGEEIHVATSAQESEHTILGFVSVWVPQKFIHHLYISPEHQKKGVAQALIQQCICSYGLPLSLKSDLANQEACRFYEHNHWVAESTHESPSGPYHYYWLRHLPEN
jgi:ribosomal protein S18 acetylase RimI-like enzyme